MRPGDRGLAQQHEAGFRSFEIQDTPLPGIANRGNRVCLIEQLVESVRRIKYISVICREPLSQFRADPTSHLFDPIKAAVLRMHAGLTDEAFWLIFYSVHFGKHRIDRWRLARDIYGHLGGRQPWDWRMTSADPAVFRAWLATSQRQLNLKTAVRRGHRRAGQGFR